MFLFKPEQIKAVRQMFKVNDVCGIIVEERTVSFNLGREDEADFISFFDDGDVVKVTENEGIDSDYDVIVSG